MRTILSGVAAAALVVVLAPAFAQSAPPAPPGVAQGTAPAAAAPNAHVRGLSDRTMTRDEVVRHVRAMFARLDSNRDGYVTREEVEAVHGKMAGMHERVDKLLAERGVARHLDRGAMFDRMDANHDGSISRQEFMASRPELREKRVMVMRDGGAPGAPGMPGMDHMRMMPMRGAGMHFGGRLFDMADANHDGRVSLAEAQAAALAHFDRADLNHDGRTTPDERQHMRTIRIERRQG